MLSIIIPTYNEADQIVQTISKIHAASNAQKIELIIVDGGSTDKTIDFANECGAITLQSEHKGRAAQMNKGASIAKGEILYFLHADSIPPQNFIAHILACPVGPTSLFHLQKIETLTQSYGRSRKHSTKRKPLKNHLTLALSSLRYNAYLNISKKFVVYSSSVIDPIFSS